MKIKTPNKIKQTNNVSLLSTFKEHVFLAPHQLREIQKNLKDC